MKRYLIFLLILAFSSASSIAQVDEAISLKTSKAVAYAKSPPLAEIAARLSPDKDDAITEIREGKNILNYEKWPKEDISKATLDNVQSVNGQKIGRGPLVGFAGQGATGVYPPDTDGDVSDTHFIQVVNSKYNVYLKDGTKVLGPLNLSKLWESLPGPWVGTNDGDPIVLYDELAQRWIITQFSPANSTHNYELFAVSATNDPLGSYHLYAFEFGVYFNDYPKIGVWSDGYYATYNLFSNNYNPSFIGSKITVVEREKMLIGDPDAAMIEFLKYNYYATMPADIDGEEFVSGAPCPIMYINAQKKVEFWNFHADWDSPGNSTFNKQAQNITVTTFSKTPDCNGQTGAGGFVEQPGTSQHLDGLGNMIMNRLAYRKFADHESMVTTHSIKVQPGGGGNYDRSGVRWYEFRKTTGDWELYQEGTFAPDDGIHRWMGSAAMNINGDIAIGYSASDATDVYPSIRYTGRRNDDPLGEMTIAEVELKTGTANQNHWRWGDYACMNVDPENDTVFWFTTEYNGWKTWVSSFDLGGISGPSCNAGEDAYICTNDQYTTQGTGTSVASIEWTTDGDGFFSPSNDFNSTYIRGNQDVANGGCTLTLTVTGFDGTTTASDDMYLYIVPNANAGDDEDIYENESYTLQGSGSPNGTISWSTSGDGSFSDPTTFTPIYSPGASDIANGIVTLSLEVSVTSPCEDSDIDDMVLTILPVGVNDIENEGNRFSISPNPTHDIFTLNIEELSLNKDFLIVMYTSYGKEIFRQLTKAKSSNFERVIDMSDFKAGIYFVRVQSDKGIKTRKVIKR